MAFTRAELLQGVDHLAHARVEVRDDGGVVGPLHEVLAVVEVGLLALLGNLSLWMLRETTVVR